jgi:predicted dehydrogenase
MIVKLAVIGLSNMGGNHCRDIYNMEKADLAAVCDTNRGIADSKAEEYGCPAYYSIEELFKAGGFDAVVIATPHFAHTTISLEAFKRGIHVLTEKPVGVHVKDINKMIKAWEEGKKVKKDLLFSAMFQQRTRGPAKKIKELLDAGELGKLFRTSWIITDWYRTQAYYNSGGWRATWEGEGGGVLMNQCPHQLDMYQWFVGCPDRVMGMFSLGKYHNIEVEDEVTAYFEYDNGMVGHFITSTGEAPGTNRLEIVGEQGKLIWEGSTLTFYRNRISVLDHLETAPGGFDKPECWTCDIPISESGGEHKLIIENFCDAIMGKADLIAPAAEGLNSIAINNAIMLSGFEKRMMTLPLDEDLFELRLKELIAGSTLKKTVVETIAEDMRQSF